jgi:hypothetical protein
MSTAVPEFNIFPCRATCSQNKVIQSWYTKGWKPTRTRHKLIRAAFHIADDGFWPIAASWIIVVKPVLLQFYTLNYLVDPNVEKYWLQQRFSKQKSCRQDSFANWRSVDGPDIAQYIGYVGYDMKIRICHSCTVRFCKIGLIGGREGVVVFHDGQLFNLFCGCWYKFFARLDKTATVRISLPGN